MISIYLIIDHLFITNSYLMHNLYLFSIDSLHSNICTSLYIPTSLYTLSTNSPLLRHLTVLHSSSIYHHSLLFQKNYPLFEAEPHVFLCREHPLANQDKITLEELEDFPYLCYDQGEDNSFYFSEEIFKYLDRKMTIKSIWPCYYFQFNGWFEWIYY